MTRRHAIPSRFRPLALATGLALLPLLAGAAEPWQGCEVQTRQPAALPEASDAKFGGLTPAPANDVGCLFGWSLQVEPGVTLWRCAIVPDEDTPEEDIAEDAWPYAFLLLRDGQPAQAWRDDLMAGMYNEFRVYTVDLDGDGTREHVVALWNAQGNGLGVNSWALHVFDADWKRLDGVERIADWGASSLRAAPAPRKGCDIASTDFVEDSTNGRDGIAFEATFLQLRDGKLVPAADRPAQRRRYTFSFQKQRTAWFDAEEGRLEGDPAGWLGAPIR